MRLLFLGSRLIGRSGGRNADEAIAAGIIRLIPWILGWAVCFGIAALVWICTGSPSGNPPAPIVPANTCQVITASGDILQYQNGHEIPDHPVSLSNVLPLCYGAGTTVNPPSSASTPAF